jgi:nitroreductase
VVSDIGSSGRLAEPADEFPEGVDRNAVLDAIGSSRAIRRLRPDPVPDPLIETLVWAATRAASPNNTQLWHFVIVRDAEMRAAIGAAVHRFVRWIDRLGPPADERDARIRADARHLIVHVADAPVLIVVCAEHGYPAEQPDEKYLWSAVNTASQNLTVAARSLGLGTTLTMMHVGNEQAVHDLLGLPDHVRIGTIIPVGWPERPFGPVRRRPLADVMHLDGW